MSTQEQSVQSIKTSLKSVLRKDKKEQFIQTINSIVFKTHSVKQHAYHLLKIIFIYCFDNDKTLPELSVSFIRNVLKAVCRPKEDGRGRPKKDIEQFRFIKHIYEELYLPTRCDEPISYKELNYIFEYLAVEMETAYKNNCMLHFTKYIKRYI